MTLAYVFWHWPAPGVPRAGCEAALLAFQRALDRPAQSYRLDRAPWAATASHPYEDWYPVDDWSALGELNDRAVTGERRAPHDDIARASGTGAGGVYRLLRPGTAGRAVRHAAWLEKPAGTASADVVGALSRTPGAAIWQRQLVLGPAPEFAVLAAEPIAPAWPAVRTAPRPL